MVKDPRKLQADVLPTGHESRSSAVHHIACFLPLPGHLLYPSEAISPFSRLVLSHGVSMFYAPRLLISVAPIAAQMVFPFPATYN